MDDATPTKGERTRAAILQAAYELFIEQGYHGTSMRQVAGRCGIALSSLYNHFPSKEDVFKAVFIENHPYREILPMLLNARGGDIESLVKNAAGQLLDALHHQPYFLNLMFIEMVEFRSAHVAELFQQIFPTVLPFISQITEKGQGRLRPIPPPILIRAFLGLFFSYYITELILAPVAPPDFQTGAMDHFADIYLHGILTDS